MANYSLVVDSKFLPFSFERYIQPYQMYELAYREVENAYNDLSTKAGVWERLANEYPDSKASRKYKQFSEELKNQADLLAKEGLNASIRRASLDMKNRYNSTIVPIEEAYTQTKKLAEELRKLKASDPYIMFDRDYSTEGIDTVLDNPNIGYNAVRGLDLYKQGKDAGKAASQRIFKDPVLKDQFYQIELGYGRDAALQFLKDNTSIEELNESIKDIMSSSGANALKGKDPERAKDLIVRGMFDGMTYNIKYEDNSTTDDTYKKFLMRSLGFDPKTGEVDKNSPYWVEKGIKFDENGKAIVGVKPGTEKPKEELNETLAEETDGAITLVAQNTAVGKYMKDYNLIGPSDKPDIIGDMYRISGTGAKAKLYKGNISKALQTAIDTGTAVVFRYGDDTGHRGFLKIGKWNEDVPDNMSPWADFGARFDDNFIETLTKGKDIDVILSSDNVDLSSSYPDAGNYNLDNYVIIKIKGKDYVGIPKNLFEQGELPKVLITSRYGGGW